MRRTLIGVDGLALIASLVLSLLRVGAVHAQPALPRPTPDAKACAYLPVAELEAHFRTPAENISGLDQTTRNTCNARFGDVFHAVAIESHPPSAADQAMTAAERLAVVKQGMKGILDTKDFGSIGCFRTTLNMGKTVHSTACFLAKAPYLSLSLQSVDPSQVSIEAAKGLLEKASARRK